MDRKEFEKKYWEYGWWRVYVIKMNWPWLHRIHKIWMSTYYKDRIHNISSQLPYPIECVLLFHLDKYNEFENLLHKHFSKKRLNGERFKLEQYDIKCINILYEEFIKNWKNEKVKKKNNPKKSQLSDKKESINCEFCWEIIIDYKINNRKFCSHTCFSKNNLIW